MHCILLEFFEVGHYRVPHLPPLDIAAAAVAKLVSCHCTGNTCARWPSPSAQDWGNQYSSQSCRQGTSPVVGADRADLRGQLVEVSPDPGDTRPLKEKKAPPTVNVYSRRSRVYSRRSRVYSRRRRVYSRRRPCLQQEEHLNRAVGPPRWYWGDFLVGIHIIVSNNLSKK